MSGSDDRDRAGAEERLEGRPHRDVIARRDLLAIAAGGRDREPDLELAAFAGAGDREPCVAEDAQHRVVLVQHLGDELLDPGIRRVGREPLEQPGPDPTSLELVADRERDFCGAWIAQPDPVRESDDAAAERTEQRAALLPVRVEHGFHQLRAERRKAVEAEVAAVLREIREELDECIHVLRDGCSQPERRAVAEDDVRCREGSCNC